MKKLPLVLLLILFSSLPLASHEGSLAGAGKLRVSKTKYFDIIYSEKNLATATILYENADSIFEELAQTYGLEQSFRLPVVITTTVEQFNAYYADSPYNRIVIYDTAQIDDLAVFSQTLLSTFTHELTHAVTYNHKNKTMRTLGKLFGDAFANHYITVTSGMAEGATVSYESSKGEGRLNDPYALQMLRQAKIEGKFPAYADVTGASDSYPRNSFYYFNGAFADYLQRTFGMHKYAEFWYRCINIEHLSDLTAGGAFKKTYGIKLKKAWKMFEEVVEVPLVEAAEPVAAGISQDFFKQGKGKLSIKNKAGSLYSDLCTSENGIVFVDQSCNAVYFYSEGKIKKLFTRDYLDTVKLSHDGRFLAVGYYTQASPTIKHCAALYDMQQKKWISISGTNYTNPAVVSDGSSYYFVAQNYEAQKYSICIKKIEEDGRKVKVCDELYAQKTFGQEEVPAYFTDFGNGSFAFVLKSALDYSVCVSDLSLSAITEYAAPVEKMKLRDLSVSGSKLLFSWATKETLPRFGYLDLADSSFYLSQENISGGVYTPVEYEGQLYYTAHFYKETRLLELVNAYKAFDQYDTRALSQMDLALGEGKAGGSTTISSSTPPYISFSPLNYAFEGLFIPIGGINTSTPLLGFTYLTSLPWYASITLFSGGYDTISKTGVFELMYQSGTDTNLFQYSIGTSFAMDEQGFKYFSGNAQASTTFDIGKISLLYFAVQAEADYGRLSNIGSSQSQSTDRFFKTLQAAAVAYSNIISTGPGPYEKAGFTFTSTLVHDFEGRVLPLQQQIMDYYDLSLSLLVRLPKLLPVICLDNLTYNLPLLLNADLFSYKTTLVAPLEAQAELILFGCDIQKAVPGIPAVFANDIKLSLLYTAGVTFPDLESYSVNWHILLTPLYVDLFQAGKYKYMDYATLKLSMGLTPNIGAFANNAAKFNLYCSLHFGNPQNLPSQIFNFGIEGNF